MTSKMFNAILKEGRDKHKDDWMAGKPFSYIIKKIRSHLTKFKAGLISDEDSEFTHLEIIEFYIKSLTLFAKHYPECDDRGKK